MDSTTLTRQVKLEKWTEMIRERNESGLTIAQWCTKHSINQAKYYYWLKRVRQAACDQLPAVNSGSVNHIVPVTFEAPAASFKSKPCSTYTMRVTIKGCSVEFTNDATPRLIETALQVLNHVR